MPLDDRGLEEKLAKLETRIESLERNFADLARSVGEARASGLDMPPLFGGGGEGISMPAGSEPISDEAISWAGRASVLPRAATVSFLLVIALILRTVADSGMMDKLLGAAIGMGYAIALVVASWFMYRRTSPEAPVFAASGAVLLSTVVVETHTRFQALPLLPAFLTLIVMGVGLAIVSKRFKTYLPVTAGVLGMCIAGAAMDFPNPVWPMMALILLVANALGFYASTFKGQSWLRWVVLIVTVGMAGWWSATLALAGPQGASQVDLYLDWFGPALAVLFAAFLLFGIVGIVRKFESSTFDTFDLMAPPIAAIWVYASATLGLGALGFGIWPVSALGAALAILHLAIAGWLKRRGKERTAPATSYAVAAILLLLMAMPRGEYEFAPGLAAVALAAFGYALLSRKWQAGGMRVASYFAQFVVAFGLAVDILARNMGALRGWEMIPALVLAASGIFQFAWCRDIIPPPASWISSTDRRDRSAVVVLVGGLSSLFMAGRIGLAQLVRPMLAQDQTAWFVCGQSVLINVAAVGVVIFALTRADRELRNVSLLIVIAGALKVFGLDLLNYHGLPLVASVLTFGVAAAVFSVALGRWPRAAKPAD